MEVCKDAWPLSVLPSEHFRRQCYVATEADERMTPIVIDLLGDANILFSTDWPHPDSLFPNSRKTFMDLPLTDNNRKQILWNNPSRLYRLDNRDAKEATYGSGQPGS